MRLIGVARLGKDAEVKFTQSGTAVANLSLAYNHGMKGADGKKPTQWVEASLWGKQAEALAEWLVKGQQVFVDCDDVHIETYEGRNGTGHKLVARVQSLELVGGAPQSTGAPQGQRPAAQPQGQQRQAPAARPAPQTDMDEDIPF